MRVEGGILIAVYGYIQHVWILFKCGLNAVTLKAKGSERSVGVGTGTRQKWSREQRPTVMNIPRRFTVRPQTLIQKC